MVGDRPLTLLSNMRTNLNLTDMETCYKTARTEKLNRKNAEWIRVRSEYYGSAGTYQEYKDLQGRTYEEGRKIKRRTGIAAIWYIIKYRISR